MFSDGGARAPTHAAVPLDKLMRLALELADAAGGGEVTPERVDEWAEEHGVPRSHVVAAAALAPGLAFAARQPVAFVVCTGGCQGWGALEHVEHLLGERDRRVAAGRPAFDVVGKSCLDRCEESPVVLVRTPAGLAGLLRATRAQLDEAVAAAVDEEGG